ncbi:hypothetical protein [Oerskovia sp. Root22]|uniref:hypothetical protein n=1 Tax=Oerskovia sp. Root22 TaxID=1736494 RepID=UPI0012F9BF92|nr:hypothetical protein [Oerskovia sp. Root22]
MRPGRTRTERQDLEVNAWHVVHGIATLETTALRMRHATLVTLLLALGVVVTGATFAVLAGLGIDLDDVMASINGRGAPWWLLAPLAIVSVTVALGVGSRSRPYRIGITAQHLSITDGRSFVHEQPLATLRSVVYRPGPASATFVVTGDAGTVSLLPRTAGSPRPTVLADLPPQVVEHLRNAGLVQRLRGKRARWTRRATPRADPGNDERPRI